MERPEWLEKKYLSHPKIKPVYRDLCRAWEEVQLNKTTGHFESAAERYADLYEKLIRIWNEVKDDG